MNMFNIAGRLTADPSLFKNTDGSATALFTVAVQRDYKKKGTTQADSDFVQCSKYISADQMKSGSTGVIAYMQKGRLVSVSGSIRSWAKQDANGETKRGMNFVAEKISLLDGSKTANAAKNAAVQAGNVATPVAPVAVAVAADAQAQAPAVPEALDLTDLQGVEFE